MKKILSAFIACLFLFLGLFLLFFYLIPWLKADNAVLELKSSIPTKVSLNSVEMGSTPFRNEKLKVGSYKVDLKAKFATESSKIVAGKEVKWSGQVNLSSGIMTVINVDFGPSDPFTASEILSLQTGNASVSVVSQPSAAKITIDEGEAGQTPLNKDLKVGVHRLKISADGYLSRQIDINIQKGFQTTVKVSLALNPLNKVGSKLLTKNSTTLYELPTDQEKLLDQTDKWAEAAFFFQEKDTSLTTKFDGFIDDKGKIFYADQTDFQAKLKANKALSLGYLGKSGEKLTPLAQKTWDSLFPSVKISQVQIQSTPTGTLNVRESTSTSSKILTTIKPNEKYDLIAEQPGWYQIKVGSIQGWISAQYAKKI